MVTERRGDWVEGRGWEINKGQGFFICENLRFRGHLKTRKIFKYT